jgi:hypothetical protein
MRYGVEQARRAGLGPGDVLNTLPFEEFWAAIQRRPAVSESPQRM